LTISKPDAERVLRDFLEGKVAYPDDCAVRWLEDLLKYHLLQRATDNRIEFRHQLIQEYYAAEYLWQRLADISNERLTWEYLNYFKWTEPLALMLALVDDPAQAVRVVNLALKVDLRLGARLAGEVQPRFQEQTVGLVIQKDLHPLLKIELLATTRSDSAVPSLLQALNHKDNWGSYTAVEALGYIGSQAAVDALTQAFYHEDPYGRSAAVYELKKIGNQAAVDALIKALSHQDNILCLNAVEALGTIGNPAAVDALTQALNHEYSEIPREAVKALSKIGNSAAVKALKQAFLNHKNFKIRCEAAEALHRILHPQIEIESTTIKDSEFLNEDATYVLGEIASFEILPELTERLGKTSLGKTRRINVFYTIARIQETLEIIQL
jgi:HEAT repeat protein